MYTTPFKMAIEYVNVAQKCEDVIYISDHCSGCDAITSPRLMMLQHQILASQATDICYTNLHVSIQTYLSNLNDANYMLSWKLHFRTHLGSFGIDD